MVRVSGIFVNMNIPSIEELPFTETLPKSTYYKETKTVDFVDTIPDEQGVYFFINYNGEVIYIGEASSIRRRLKNHHEILTDHRKEIISISWIVLPCGHEIERFILEKAYIMAYKPKLNHEIGNSLER